MNILDSLIKSTTTAPPKIVLYGVAGIGKTTFAGKAGSVLVDCENGAGFVPNRTPYLDSWPKMREWLVNLTKGDLGGCSVVSIDTIDWMLHRIVEYVVVDLDKKNTKDITNTLGSSHGGYFKARDIVQNIVSRELFLYLNALTTKGVAPLLLAHAANTKVTTPEGYDLRLAGPDLPQWIAPLFIEWADCVLYAHYTPDKKRVIQTTGSNVVLAKNRYSLPEYLPLDWTELMNAIAKGMN